MQRQYEAVSPGTLRWVAWTFAIGTLASIAATIAVIASHRNEWHRTIGRNPCAVGVAEAIATKRNSYDEWGTPYRVACVDRAGGIAAIDLISAGPDLRFETGDDVVTHRVAYRH
jgi:hypothetical protein